MTPHWHAASSLLAADLRTIFGARLLSIVAYGARLDADDRAPLTCLALVETLTTLDLDPHVRAFGAARHITGHLERIGAHFEPGTLDAIVASGVIGWGLNEPAAIELALGACVDALRPGGLLILGWNDVPNRRPIIPREARAVAAVAPFDFPPIGRSAHLCAGANRHTFDFFTKPEPTR